MNKANKITRARTVAKIAHAGTKYGEHDYFDYHVMAVATRVLNDPDSLYGHMEVAYLHDVVEDTSVTIEDLVAMGFDEEIVAAVDKITRKAGVTYLDYIRDIAADEDNFAYMVKYHDLHENHANSITDGGKENLVARYEKAIAIMLGEAE
jgi:(p)ppGpp synthase/HD superfamily hydrolase